jgi:putative tryptophan/tyrosine transport system substrate-binding protein
VRRRKFITLIGGATAWPLAARAQRPAKIARVGIIDDAPIWDHFRQGLREAGYVEGQNLAIEHRSADGQPERLAAAARELVAMPVDVIAVYGTAATHAAQQATTTIPIVMIAIGDPIRAGLVPSLARPGRNTTGNTILGTEMSAKRLQVFKELIPQLSRVAFLWNSNNGSHQAYLDEWRALAPKLGLHLMFVDVHSSDQFESAFAAMMQQRPDALSVTADAFHMSHVGWIIDFAAKHRLPAMYIVRDNVAAGGLISYGPSISDLYRRAASYVHKILEGAKPAELPVEQPRPPRRSASTCRRRCSRWPTR